MRNNAFQSEKAPNLLDFPPNFRFVPVEMYQERFPGIYFSL